MVDVIDTGQDFTINLLVPVPEGEGRVIGYTAPTEAYVGDPITVTVDVMNDGGEDAIYSVLVDLDTGEIAGVRQETFLSSGGTITFTWSLAMPNKTWNLSIRAGHVE